MSTSSGTSRHVQRNTRSKLRLERFLRGVERSEPSRNYYIDRTERGKLLLTFFLITLCSGSRCHIQLLHRGGSVWGAKTLFLSFFFLLTIDSASDKNFKWRKRNRT